MSSHSRSTVVVVIDGRGHNASFSGNVYSTIFFGTPRIIPWNGVGGKSSLAFTKLHAFLNLTVLTNWYGTFFRSGQEVSGLKLHFARIGSLDDTNVVAEIQLNSGWLALGLPCLRFSLSFDS